ncbi:MAG: type I DNA topoisomerase [Candidatus Hydrogenedentes bacterium]|nr:type I DNA topoisomerase [Candidatus Hydrogenedentota bacterium]
MKLVIVESPAKAKTIGKFLGKDHKVLASYGHVRDLPSSADEIPATLKGKPWARLAVDVENDFAPVYVVQSDSKKQIAELKKSLKDAEEVVLATDEDREGEAISWHLLEVLKPKVPVKRIVFHEITQEAIAEAAANPRDVNQELVRAQEGRRILDRLYGYSLSPVLWKKVRTKLSAGRVQSVAVRLVVEREEERRAFHKANYWDIEAALEADGIGFTATLVEVAGQRIASGKDFDETTGLLKSDKVRWVQEAEATSLCEALRANVPWTVTSVQQKEARLRPYPPFITSTLQQAASSLLGFSPRDTMRVAQRLYEGVDVGGGEREGLITYMRTDSVTLSNRALAEAEKVIKDKFGDRYHHRRQFSTKSKMAQEAHEAIRPTHLGRTPEQASRFISGDDLRLYTLIWNRTLASQMADAELLRTTIDFSADGGGKPVTLRSNGSVVTFPGFLRVADSGQQDSQLPALSEGDQAGPSARVSIADVKALGHETKPPARYNEASLVRRLEEEGIGRPSTYAPTISTIQQRGYVQKVGKALAPTFVGIAVTSLLREHFPEYIELSFTAKMETALDEIAEGKVDWVDFLRAFYQGHGEFGEGLAPKIASELEKIEFPIIPVGVAADGQPLVVRLGRTQPFIQRGEGGNGNTAPIPEGVTYDELTVELAEELLVARAKADEPIGQDPETGQNVYAILGPYGPYVQLGEQDPDSKKKPKRASLGRGFPLENVTLEIALQYLSLPRHIGEHPESGKSVRSAIGRFGPYIVHDGDFRSLKTVDDVFNIDLKTALEMLAQPKRRGRQKTLLREVGPIPNSEKKIEMYDGRYGPYVTDGEVNASLPKDADPEAFSVEQALALLEAAATKKSPRKKKAASKKKPAAKKKAAAKKKPAAKKKAASGD